jgi:DNA-binding NtrC family response regulator
VFGIVKQCGGHVEVYSELGWGATFKIYLPRVDEAAEPLEMAPGPTSLARGAETILLVEDDEMVRRVVRDGLQQAGYTVIAVAQAMEAIQVFEEGTQKIELLVTDAVMPRMSGRELVRSLRARGLAGRVLYISGHTAPVALALMEKDPEATFLQKPFTPEVLAAKVREALDLRDRAA